MTTGKQSSFKLLLDLILSPHLDGKEEACGDLGPDVVDKVLP